MKTAIATLSLSGDLREKLEAAAAAGLTGIELCEPDVLGEAMAPREIGAMIRDLGLAVTAFQPFADVEGLPPELRRRMFDRAEAKFDLMADLGAATMLVPSSTHPEALGGVDRASADLAELAGRAAARGLRIGYEAQAWGRHVSDYRDAWEIVRRAGHPALGLVLDSFHVLARDISAESIRAIPGDRIFLVQMADAPRIAMDLPYLSRHFRVLPGEGELDMTGFARAVMATGYDGPFSVEISADQVRAGLARTLAHDARLSLLALADAVRRAEPGLPADLPPMPAPIPAHGTAFVEFATRGPEAEVLAGFLGTLGFERVGRHMAKAVSLWQQGDIRVVLNEEPRDFAGSAYNMHGTCVCDIGLTVGSAADTLDRAAALGFEAFRQPAAPGQHDIPAIRGPGGKVLHFLDAGAELSRVWTDEFGAAEGPVGAGLTRIDHIAQAMAPGEMLSWSLFYRALFDMDRTPMVDVPDPGGLVASQAVAGDGLRITLNGAQTHRTLVGAMLAESFGAPVQHVALAAADIFATAEALARRGFQPLAIPENYYSDLATRFELAPELLERLQRWNILYDRDAGGEFFQFYSAGFAGGVFFEFLERRGGYAGYGAPNAPFRIAAQKRLTRARIPAGL